MVPWFLQHVETKYSGAGARQSVGQQQTIATVSATQNAAPSLEHRRKHTKPRTGTSTRAIAVDKLIIVLYSSRN